MADTKLLIEQLQFLIENPPSCATDNEQMDRDHESLLTGVGSIGRNFRDNSTHHLLGQCSSAHLVYGILILGVRKVAAQGLYAPTRQTRPLAQSRLCDAVTHM